MPIDMNEAATFYSQGTAANVGKWASRTAAAAEDWAVKAKSNDAENNYKTGVEFAARNRLRQKGLQNVTAADFRSGVEAGQAGYQAKTAAAGSKWAAKFEPFAKVIDGAVARLPARIPGDARNNVLRRVVPIAEALQKAKLTRAR